jgi:hypothetical protein
VHTPASRASLSTRLTQVAPVVSLLKAAGTTSWARVQYPKTPSFAGTEQTHSTHPPGTPSSTTVTSDQSRFGHAIHWAHCLMGIQRRSGSTSLTVTSQYSTIKQSRCRLGVTEREREREREREKTAREQSTQYITYFMVHISSSCTHT